MLDYIDVLMNKNVILLFLIFIISIIISFVLGKLFGKILEQRNFQKIIKNERMDAVKRSRAVIGGQVSEQIAPFFPNFPCNPNDCRFIGKPLDFVCFSGLTETDKISEIVFIEVKTGNSELSNREKQVKDAVKNGNVRYVEYRISS